MSSPQMLLPRNLAALAKCCAKGDQLRYGATTGVQLEAHATDADGNDYCATVTDGRQLVTVAGAMPFDCKDYPTFPALESAPNSGTCNVVGAREWVSAFKMIPKRTYKPILNTLPVVLGADVTTFGTTDMENCQAQTPINLTRLQQIDGGKPGAMAPVARFPDWRRSLPTDSPRYTISLDPRIVSQVCDTLAALTGDDNQRVDLDLFAPDKPIRLTAKNNDNGQTITALIVPLVSSDTGKAPKPMTAAEAKDNDDWRARAQAEYDAERDAWRKRIVELETERDSLQADLNELSGAEKTDWEKRALEIATERDDYAKPLESAGFNDVAEVLAELASVREELQASEDTAADAVLAREIDARRLSDAWTRINNLETVNAILRKNFDALAAKK